MKYEYFACFFKAIVRSAKVRKIPFLALTFSFYCAILKTIFYI